VQRRVTNHRIDQLSYRRKCAPRPKDPYKSRLGKGRWIGYLKGEGGSESWCACWIDETGRERQQVVGSVAELSYEDAERLVGQEIDHNLTSAADANYTVRRACEDYIENQRNLVGEKAGTYARNILGPFVLALPIADVKLRALRHHHLTSWRDQLPTLRTADKLADQQRREAQIAAWEAKHAAGARVGRRPADYLVRKRKPNTCNRVLRTFKAALNFAKAEKHIRSDDAWKDVKGFKKAKDGSRDVFLSVEQRRTLFKYSGGDLRDFLLGNYYPAARPHELRDANAEDFDAATGTLRLTKFKGTGEPKVRRTFLTPDAVAFFKEQSRDKLPKAPLLTRHGERWQRKWWCRDLRNAVKRARAAGEKLPNGIVAYSMRHAAISEWLSAGVDVARVAKAVGTSIKMIQDHYAQFIREDFVEKLANVKAV
jgi:integrase